jgi:hypothetical protein
VKRKASTSTVTIDFNSPEALERFRKAAAAFTKKATRTRAAARQVSIDEGIHTKSGKLTKNYR